MKVNKSNAIIQMYIVLTYLVSVSSVFALGFLYELSPLVDQVSRLRDCVSELLEVGLEWILLAELICKDNNELLWKTVGTYLLNLGL